MVYTRVVHLHLCHCRSHLDIIAVDNKKDLALLPVLVASLLVLLVDAVFVVGFWGG